MITMLRKLWDTTFHLEGKFIRSCWQLFIPGKVTTEFFKGKQDRYPHPLRMFAIVMFFFLIIVNSLLKDLDTTGSVSFFDKPKSNLVENGDTTLGADNTTAYEQLKYKTLLYDMRQDYEKLPDAWRTASSRSAVDSLLRKAVLRNGIDDEGLLDSLDTYNDTTNLNLWGNKKIRIASMDIARYEPEEIIRRYDIKDWTLQLLVRQTIKSYKNPDALVHSIIGSMTWTLLALVAFMSSILALLYRRQKRFYVEHFIFLLHFHTGLMLALLLLILGLRLELWSPKIFIWLLLGTSLFKYLALKRYYGQGWRKTLVKWIIFGFLYSFAFSLLFILGVTLVFAIY